MSVVSQSSDPAAREAAAPPRPRRWVQAVSMAGILAVIGIGWKILSRPSSPIPAGAASSPASGSGGGSGGRAGGGAGQKSAGVPVIPATARRKDMTQVLFITGTLRTDNEVAVGSRIPGKAAQVTVKEGDRVHPGQLLVALDDSEVRSQVARAEGAYRSAQARLSQLRNSRNYRITQLRKDLERAQKGVTAAQAKVGQAKSSADVTESEIEARIESAQQNLNAAQERLKMVRDGARKQELAQAALAVEQARAEMRNAQAFYDRRARLYAGGLISKEEVDEAATKMRVAVAAHDVAKQRQDLMKEGARTEEVRVAEAAVAAAKQALVEAEGARGRKRMSAEEIRTAEAELSQAESARDAAQAAQEQDRSIDDEIHAAEATVAQNRADITFYQTQQHDMRITSPVSGVVSTRSVDVGESVTPSTVLMNLVALDTIYLEAQVPEADLGQVRPGMNASVTIDALGGRKFTGTVRELIPVADPAVRAFRVRIAVLGASGGPRLPAGSFARANVYVGTRRGAITIPKSAIRSEMGLYVFAIKDGKAIRTPIRTGLTDDQDAEILSGLPEGQQIVAAGSPAIADGTPVTIAPPADTQKKP